MGSVRNERVQEELKHIANNPQENHCLRLVAGLSLAKNKDETGKALALQAIENGDPCADYAIHTLSQLKAVDLIPVLQKNLRTPKTSMAKDDIRIAMLEIELAGVGETAKRDLLTEVFHEPGYDRAYLWAAEYFALHGGIAGLNTLAQIARDASLPEAATYGASVGIEMGVERGYWTADQAEKAIKN